MGSIVRIYRDPKQIKMVHGQKATLKTTGEEVVQVMYGYADYDYEGECDLTIYMRRWIYEGIKTLKYRIKIINDYHFTVVDENGNLIPPYNDGMIY